MQTWWSALARTRLESPSGHPPSNAPSTWRSSLIPASGSRAVDFEAQIVDDAFDPWASFVEHLGCSLQRLEASGGGLRVGIDLALQSVKASDEPLVDLVEQELRLWVHGAALPLQTGVVGMGKSGIGWI